MSSTTTTTTTTTTATTTTDVVGAMGGGGGVDASCSVGDPLIGGGGVNRLYGAPSRDSVDSQFTEPDEDEDVDDELRFFESCVECDDDALYDIIHDGVTWDEVNRRDKSGRTGMSHACGNGFMPILQLLDGVEEVDPNLPDNDGNTPLIFAAQAGHDDIVNFLLRRFHRLKVDQCNKLGFTALMKAAIQGRTRCAKLLLFAGASPNRRDYGRRLCAEEWARFCGRHSCADAIAKYIRSTKYFFAKTFLLAKDKWKSEPDLLQLATSSGGGTSSSSSPVPQHKGTRRDSGGWIQRHLSLKRKKHSQQAVAESLASDDCVGDQAIESSKPAWRSASPGGLMLRRSGSMASTSRRRRSSQTAVGHGGPRATGRRSSCAPTCSSVLLPQIRVTSEPSSPTPSCSSTPPLVERGRPEAAPAAATTAAE